MDPKKYEHGAVVSAEGARIAFVVCKRCGAAILLHPTIDTMKLHDEWHDEIRAMIACPQDFDLWPAPTEQGEGDDLAARLDSDRLQEWFTEIQASASLLPEDLQIIASMIARASTHPEQWARVDPEQLRLVRNMAKIEASQSDPEQAPAFTDKRRASHRRRADALNAVLAALEPASPTPTEQENDR